MNRKPDGSGQMYGKMMIDMRTGDIWGFPTLVEGPYPVDPGRSEPPHSRPIYLGKFVLSDAHRGTGIYLAAETYYSASKSLLSLRRHGRDAVELSASYEAA